MTFAGQFLKVIDYSENLECCMARELEISKQCTSRFINETDAMTRPQKVDVPHVLHSSSPCYCMMRLIVFTHRLS